MLTIVRLRPSFLEEWNKGPSVVADCSIGYYSCFTGFFTAQFTRSVGDLQLSNTSSTPKIGQKGNNYCVKLQQLSSDLSDFPACSTDVRFGSKADICAAIRHVRFTPNSDRKSGLPHKVMSALPPKADMSGATLAGDSCGVARTILALWSTTPCDAPTPCASKIK